MLYYGVLLVKSIIIISIVKCCKYYKALLFVLIISFSIIEHQYYNGLLFESSISNSNIKYHIGIILYYQY